MIVSVISKICYLSCHIFSVFFVKDKNGEYQYRIDLCCSMNEKLSIEKINLGKGGKSYQVGGSCDEARMFGGCK